MKERRRQRERVKNWKSLKWIVRQHKCHDPPKQHLEEEEVERRAKVATLLIARLMDFNEKAAKRKYASKEIKKTAVCLARVLRFSFVFTRACSSPPSKEKQKSSSDRPHFRNIFKCLDNLIFETYLKQFSHPNILFGWAFCISSDCVYVFSKSRK